MKEEGVRNGIKLQIGGERKVCQIAFRFRLRFRFRFRFKSKLNPHPSPLF